MSQEQLKEATLQYLIKLGGKESFQALKKQSNQLAVNLLEDMVLELLERDIKTIESLQESLGALNVLLGTKPLLSSSFLHHALMEKDRLLKLYEDAAKLRKERGELIYLTATAFLNEGKS